MGRGPGANGARSHGFSGGRAHDKHRRRGRVRAGWGGGCGWGWSMAGCVGGLGKGNVCGAGRADGRGAGAWVVGVGAEGRHGARSHGSMALQVEG